MSLIRYAIARYGYLKELNERLSVQILLWVARLHEFVFIEISCVENF